MRSNDGIMGKLAIVRRGVRRNEQLFPFFVLICRRRYELYFALC